MRHDVDVVRVGGLHLAVVVCEPGVRRTAPCRGSVMCGIGCPPGEYLVAVFFVGRVARMMSYSRCWRAGGHCGDGDDAQGLVGFARFWRELAALSWASDSYVDAWSRLRFRGGSSACRSPVLVRRTPITGAIATLPREVQGWRPCRLDEAPSFALLFLTGWDCCLREEPGDRRSFPRRRYESAAYLARRRQGGCSGGPGGLPTRASAPP